MLRNMRFVGCFVMAICMFSPAVALAACGEQCDAKYASDIDECHTQFGDNPADAAELTDCIQEAGDAYRGCLDDCSTQLILYSRLSVGSTKGAALGNIGRERAKLPRCDLCLGTENNKNH
jgi:hypothetical protein